MLLFIHIFSNYFNVSFDDAPLLRACTPVIHPFHPKPRHLFEEKAGASLNIISDGEVTLWRSSLFCMNVIICHWILRWQFQSWGFIGVGTFFCVNQVINQMHCWGCGQMEASLRMDAHWEPLYLCSATMCHGHPLKQSNKWFLRNTSCPLSY